MIVRYLHGYSGISPEGCTDYPDQTMDIQEQAYLSLTGCLLPEYRLDWIENIDVPGHPFYEHYSKMMRAYERLQKRLGIDSEDRDIEEIIFSLTQDGKIASMKMFEYGITYQKMIDSLSRAENPK